MQLESHDRLDSLCGEWDALADRVSASPWLRPGWIGAWERAFGRGSLEVLTLRRDGRLVGVLPLQRRFGALRSTSNVHTPAFSMLVEDQEAARELGRSLFARGGRQVTLGFLLSDDPALDTCRSAARAARYRLIDRTLERSPYIATNGDWPGYERQRESRFLRELRRRRRRLGEQGRLALDVTDGHQRLDELLDEGFAVEAAAWKGKRGTAIAADPATRRFYGDIALWAAERGWLRLAFLRLDERPLAFDYCLEEQGVHYLLKTGYDPDYRAFAPGMLIRREMIARAFSNGLARYEFLGADEPWKLRWTGTLRERRLLQAFAPSLPGVIDCLRGRALAFARPLAKRALLARRGT
jgi:CelD/BcsL family acetyltransferase involved in cellulose biosynthesis